MHQTSDLYKEILQTNYRTDTALQIASSKAVTICTDEQLMAENATSSTDGPVYREDRVISLETSAKTFAESKPSVGSCVSRQIKLEILKPQRTIPRRARLVPYARISSEDKHSEWLPKGVFWVDTRAVTRSYDGEEVLELTGYDAMMKAEQMYVGSRLTFPAKDIDVLTEIAQRIDVVIDPATSAIITDRNQVPAVSEYTYREVLSYLGVLYGGNWIITDLGKLKLVQLKEVGA